MQNAEKVSVTMTPDMMRALRESVEAGEFASTSEAMRDAVRVWKRQRLEDAERLNAIRARVRRSIEDPRPSLSGDQADAHFDALFKKAEEDAGNAAS
ncbi:MAG TPA: ribbon-helix-helix domain-containing protein [Alphaproteobacteria bacterium]|nr:ribbon-helix-helix domain-containing protein [Alphaproteobacteria bacterium]